MKSPAGSAVVVICSTVLALAVLTIYGWQSITGRDTSQTLTLVLVTLGAAAPGVASYTRAGAIHRELDTVSGAIHRDLDTVKEQTNGTGRLLDLMARQSLPARPAEQPATDAHPPGGSPPPV